MGRRAKGSPEVLISLSDPDDFPPGFPPGGSPIPSIPSLDNPINFNSERLVNIDCTMMKPLSYSLNR